MICLSLGLWSAIVQSIFKLQYLHIWNNRTGDLTRPNHRFSVVPKIYYYTHEVSYSFIIPNHMHVINIKCYRKLNQLHSGLIWTWTFKRKDCQTSRFLVEEIKSRESGVKLLTGRGATFKSAHSQLGDECEKREGLPWMLGVNLLKNDLAPDRNSRQT